MADPIGFGDRGEDVEQVQQALADYGYTLEVDGIYGPRTYKAITHWQKVNGLVVDGIVGPKTSASLRLNGAGNSAAPAVRVDPPAPAQGLTGCEEMNYWRIQAGLPDRFSDQPRMPQVRFADQGYGWRESNCRNDVVSSTGCCVGYWQIHTGNFNAPGYKAGIAACGVSKRSDILGNSAEQKQKQACVAKVLYDVSGLSPWRL
jgi:hypothetical protein